MKQIRELGRGGFGCVDLVEDGDGSRFARKTFSVNQPAPPTLVENVRRRFIREVTVQKEIIHKNIVPILGGDLAATPPYYLMPVAESSLADDIALERTLNGSWKAALMCVCSGLEELHSLGMSHRDLKPANVLKFLDTDGAPYFSISDFGFVSVKDSSLSELTQTGMHKGSDYYSAPEIVADLRAASERSDIYSLACMLHDMVGTSNRYPCNEIFDSGPYGDIMKVCTRQDPRRRFPSVRKFADAILSIEENVGLPVVGVESYIEKLADGVALDAAFVEELVDYLRSKPGTPQSQAIFYKLDSSGIQEICSGFPNFADQLGSLFARWVDRSAFNFDMCDPISSRMEIFIAHCSMDVRIENLLAMLELGTSHNRWYVERKFVKLSGEEMDQAVARRLAIELRASDYDICAKFDHLARSIRIRRDAFHPLIAKTLGEICP